MAGDEPYRTGVPPPSPTAGATASTSTPDVFGGRKVRTASLPAASRRVPPFRSTGEATAMPSASVSPAWTTYRNVSAFVPLPDR